VLAAVSVQAAPVELVTNGEFETPGVATNGWNWFANGSVPGWTSSVSRFEIWGATYNPENNLPGLGSDGLAHGQHHELTYGTDTEFTTQAGVVSANGTVDFSFDGWRRDALGIVWSLTGSISGVLASGTLSLNDDNWHAVSANNLMVTGGETLTMRFQSTGVQAPGQTACGGGTGCGAHIDQVSLLFTVPEPMSLAMVGTGLLGLALSRRRRPA
jgi:hypothetical protein